MNGLWPENRRSAATLTVDFFDDAFILAQEPRMAGRDKSLSVWRYGAQRGVERLLRLFDDMAVRTTWFVPGCVAERHAALVRDIHAAGHEIGNATYACENFDALPLEAQADSARRAQDAIGQAIGQAPEAFRSPWGNWAPGLPVALLRAGLRWSSSWRGDDRPYFHAGEPGAQDRLLEIPLHYELEDEPYFIFNLYPPVPSGQPRIAPYRDALSNLMQDFAGFHKLGLCYPLRIHPEILGTAGRIGLLRELLEHISATPGAWLASGGEIAAWWRSRHTSNEPGHPADLFAPRHRPAPTP
ncbi:MAG TPA: polysaccharide deacetylase [Bordetella sp.]